MKIYTRTGDSGTTGLFGGPRVSKSDLRIEAYGTVDELNADIGAVRAHLDPATCGLIDDLLKDIQGNLLVLGADLATPIEARAEVPRIEPGHSARLETSIDRLETDLPDLTKFILPTGSKAAVLLHRARTVCRRAERRVVSLTEDTPIGEQPAVYLNRLSDFLFVAARWVNQRDGMEEETWTAP